MHTASRNGAEKILSQALYTIDWTSEDDRLWVRLYEGAMERGIEPYDGLKQRYQEQKKQLEAKEENT